MRRIHPIGPGLKELSEETWYGSGYCAVCGEKATSAVTCPVVARAVRYWDPDDGWRVGVLCVHCAPGVAKHGPAPGDYAYRMVEDVAERIDVVAANDLDAAYSDSL